METMKCNACKKDKPINIEHFQFRNDTNNFRRICKACLKDELRVTKKAGKIWNYEKAYDLYLKTNLTPLFKKSKKRVGAKEKLTALNKDGYKVITCIDKITQGRLTPERFSVHNPYTIENIQTFINKNNLEIIINSIVFNGNMEDLEFTCPKGHHFTTMWSDFQSRKRCTKCYYSKGEGKVINWLEENNYSYESEVTFHGLVGEANQPLRFDFAVMDNTGIKTLVEYDGELHFKVARYSNNTVLDLARLNKTQRYDEMKNTYAKDNKIKLLRIPYTEYNNIERILAAHL